MSEENGFGVSKKGVGIFLCFTLAFGVEAAAKPRPHAASLTAAAEEGPAVSKPEQLAQQRRISGYEVPGRVVEVRRGETVQSRPRPEFDPLGLRVGSFLLFPELAVRQEYDDNVFATDDEEEDDFITRLQPSVLLESDWNRHSLSLSAGGDIGLYASNEGEGYQDYFFQAAGRWEMGPRTRLDGLLGFDRLHEARTDPDNDDASDEPTEFDVFSASVRPEHAIGRFEVSLTGDFRRLDYQDTDAVGGGRVNNDDRDRNIYLAALRLGYDVTPQHQAFIDGSYNLRDYDRSPDDEGVDRDSNGFEVTTGAAVDLGGVIFGELFAGYAHQSYDDPALSEVEGPVVGGEIVWNVTRLTTVTGSVSRLIRETTISEDGEQAAARFDTRAGVSLDHELLRNLVLEADFDYINSQYEGIGRNDDIFQVDVKARYFLSRNIHLVGAYSFLRREVYDFNASGEDDGDFTRNLVSIRIEAQF